MCSSDLPSTFNAHMHETTPHLDSISTKCANSRARSTTPAVTGAHQPTVSVPQSVPSAANPTPRTLPPPSSPPTGSAPPVYTPAKKGSLSPNTAPPATSKSLKHPSAHAANRSSRTPLRLYTHIQQHNQCSHLRRRRRAHALLSRNLLSERLLRTTLKSAPNARSCLHAAERCRKRLRNDMKVAGLG